ncbi:MAG TPA: hypothetical protein VNJ03_12155 [Vicinamibacterales bacterium]|nr:hypothetical protein [Vicinamibacterales bacterium]
MRQTYDSPAWIPQSLFEGNFATQVIGDLDTIAGDTVGLVPWRGNAVVPAFGMARSLAGGCQSDPQRASSREDDEAPRRRDCQP